MRRMRLLWLLAGLSLTACATHTVAIPELERVDTIFCSDRSAVDAISGYVRGVLGEASWEEAQSRLVKSEAAADSATSLRLQQARALIARCAQLLFGAIPTGSARNLADISVTNALKDIDMSAPFENVEAANRWLRGLVKDPDRTMLLSLLAEPTSSLPCRSLPEPAVLPCTRANVLETAHIAILHEIQSVKHAGEVSFASTSDVARICPSGFLLPPADSIAYRVLETTAAEERAFAESFPLLPAEGQRYRSAVRYKVLFMALKNPAYYLQPGSIRKWVVEREEIFRLDLETRHPDYAGAARAASVEREGAVLEQWIHAMRHAKSFYYRFKYLFRAMEHIGFDVDREVPELAAMHRVMKKTRPATVADVHADYLRQLSAGAVEGEPALRTWGQDVSRERVARMVSESDDKQLNALLDYYRTRRREPDSIWNEVCRPDSS